MTTRKQDTPDAEESSAQGREIEIEHLGPIDHFRFTVPASGGLMVLKGRNGLGKSRALEAVNRHVTGHGEVDLQDGADRGGVWGLGVTMKVARSITRSGVSELEVVSLEGRFSVFDLVEPGHKDEYAADGKRIKALLQLVGEDAAKADASLFHKLLGGKKAFGETITAAALDTTDLNVMAARIKRDIEAKARTVEDQLTKAKADALANKNAAGDIDLNQPHDREVLSKALEAAVREDEKLKTEEQNALDADQRASMARRALREAQENYTGATVADAESKLQQVHEQFKEKARAREVAEEALRQAQEAERAARVALNQGETDLRLAREHEAAMESARQAVAEASNVSDVDEEQLQQAAAKVEAARKAVEQGALVRRAIQSLEQAEIHAAKAKEFEREKDRLRDAAAGVDGVLSGVVKKLGCPLRVSKGRLVTDTDRGEENFADLSRGEQWTMALNIAIDAVGKNGLLVIDQSGYEGLDGINRRLIADHLKGTGVVMLTAEATEDEELRAEEFV